MKKFFIFVGFLVCVLAVGVACSKKKSENKFEIEVNGLQEVYVTTDIIDWDNISLIVNKNGKTNELKKYAIDESNIENLQNKDFVLFTDGLFSQNGEMTVGKYKISCQILSEDKIYDLMTIEIVESMSSVYDLISFSYPSFINNYFVNKQNSIKYPNAESSYSNCDDDYYVGNDNGFEFKPVLIVQNKFTDKTIILDNFNVNLQLYQIDDNDIGEKILIDSDKYRFEKFKIYFSDELIGLKLELKLDVDFESDFAGNKVEPLFFQFKLAEGWNATTADDLARINLVDDPNSISGYARNLSEDIFYNASSGQYERLKYYEVWKQFLSQKYEEETLAEIKSIFLHNDIIIRTSDLPSEFFVSEKESAYASGSLRDYVFLYTHYLVDDFLLNGNYFTIDFSNIPLGLSNTDCDGYIYNQNQGQYYPGHSTCFVFSGKTNDSTPYSAKFINVNTIGNTNGIISGDNNDIVEKASGSLILLKSMHAKTIVENNISKSFLISWYAESSKYALEINDTKTYDCFNSAAFLYKSSSNKINNCEFKRFGGPAVLVLSSAENGAVTDYAGVETKNSVLESYVNGTEAWFSAMKANSIATQLVSLDNILRTIGKTMLINGKINLMYLAMDSDYLVSKEACLFVDISHNGALNLFSSYNNEFYNSYSSTKAPTFSSENGGVAFTDGIKIYNESVLANSKLLYILYKVNNTTAGLVLELRDI